MSSSNGFTMQPEPSEAFVKDTISALQSIKGGQQVVYHRGLFGDTEASRVIGAVGMRLKEEGRVLLTTKRTKLPRLAGKIDWQHGVGAFDYIAIGRMRVGQVQVDRTRGGHTHMRS